MNNFRFELNTKGVAELLICDKMSNICKEHAERVSSIAGDGYEAQNLVSGNRVAGRVHPVTNEAYQDNLQNNTLLKALGG